MPPASAPSPSGVRRTPCWARRWGENVQWGMKAWSGNRRRGDLPMCSAWPQRESRPWVNQCQWSNHEGYSQFLWNRHLVLRARRGANTNWNCLCTCGRVTLYDGRSTDACLQLLCIVYLNLNLETQKIGNMPYFQTGDDGGATIARESWIGNSAWF